MIIDGGKSIEHSAGDQLQLWSGTGRLHIMFECVDRALHSEKAKGYVLLSECCRGVERVAGYLRVRFSLHRGTACVCLFVFLFFSLLLYYI